MAAAPAHQVAVEPAVAVLAAAGVVQPERLRQHQQHGRDAVPERPDGVQRRYSSDYNFSRFSYERFFPGITKAQVLAKWRTDQTNLINKIKAYSNWSYHVPWERPINDSHCVSIITFIGSHACPTVRKKYWYEVLEWPWTQSWKCPSGFLPFETFLQQWVGSNTAEAHRRAGELLQRRGSRHADRRAAHQRRARRQLSARSHRAGGPRGPPALPSVCASPAARVAALSAAIAVAACDSRGAAA